jgi:hypothetical protein
MSLERWCIVRCPFLHLDKDRVQDRPQFGFNDRIGIWRPGKVLDERNGDQVLDIVVRLLVNRFEPSREGPGPTPVARQPLVDVPSRHVAHEGVRQRLAAFVVAMLR